MNNSDINRAVKILKSGGVVIFPTDTVWGIGVSVKRPEAIKRLYQIKKREKNKATAVLIANIDMAKQLGIFNRKAIELANKYWPGGLTLIVKARQVVPREIKGKNNTIGLRQPDHQTTLRLLTRLGCGLVAASANFSGQPAPITRKLVDQLLVDQVDLFMAGESGSQPASTVIDTTVSPFKIIREGELKAPLFTS